MLGSVTEFAESCDLHGLASASNLAALVVSLSNYHEEGEALLPEIYLCNDIREVTKMLPGHDLIELGQGDDASKVLLEALKKCAPLAKSNWCIFVDKRDHKYQYGLFRGSLNPLAISIEETLFSEPLLALSVARLCQTASGCVELKNTKGEVCHLLLNDKPDGSPPPNADVAKLVEQITSCVAKPIQEQTRNYLSKLIGKALSECHGALIVVLPKSSLPKYIQDGSKLQPPLDFAAVIDAFTNGQDREENEQKLNSYGSLIAGMIASDGIAAFDTQARLLAFNCFLSLPNPKQGKKVVGGARTRAYEALSARVGKNMTAAFMRSQDGWTKFRSK